MQDFEVSFVLQIVFFDGQKQQQSAQEALVRRQQCKNPDWDETLDKNKKQEIKSKKQKTRNKIKWTCE